MIYTKLDLAEGVYGHNNNVKKPWDARDHKYNRIATAPAPFDWTTTFDVETNLGQILPVENQGASFSCGGQATRYYLEALQLLNTKSFEHLSAKDPYSLIFYPGGGTDIRSIGKISVNRGVANEITVPSMELGNPPTEVFMEMQTQGINPTSLFKEFGFAMIDTDIESVAEAVRDNNGAIIEVHGMNGLSPGWLSNFPTPPTQSNGGFNHFLWACGAQTINGIKYTKVKNSWGSTVGENGYQWLSEAYFTSGNVLNGMVYYNTTTNPVYSPSAWQQFAIWFQNFFRFNTE